MTHRRFEGRRILVIGGSGAIGSSLCSLFAQEGGQVWIGYYSNGDAAVALQRQIEATGGKAFAIAIDVRSMPSIEAARDRICGSDGSLDVLVYAAGKTHEDLLLQISDSEWSEIIDINLSGAFRAIRAFGPGMMAERRGSIILVGSIAATRPLVGNSPYAVAKAGLEHLARVSAIEMGRAGVRVNVVSAGPIDGGLWKKSFGAAITESHKVIPLRRLGRTGEVAAMIAFVASDEAGFSTGAVFSLDGGLSIPSPRPPAKFPGTS